MAMLLTKATLLGGLPAAVVSLGVPGGVEPAGATTTSTVLVSKRASDGKADSGTNYDVTPDGRYVVFRASRSLIPGAETAPAPQLYVWDRDTDQTTRVSVSSSGEPANGAPTSASISADGRYVAFASDASNLVANDANNFCGFFSGDDNCPDIFVHDRQTGETTRVSVDSAGAEANGESIKPDVSADGRYVAFESDASNLVANDTNGVRDVFVHARETGETTRASVDSSGAEAPIRSSRNASISADGRYVTFDSQHSFTGEGGFDDVFVRDRVTSTTELVSRTDPVTGNDLRATDGAISGDGRFVAFTVTMSSSQSQVYRYDRVAEITDRVSVDPAGKFQHGDSFFGGANAPAISGDGRAVAFEARGNLLPEDDPATSEPDLYIRDFATGTLELAAVGNDGSAGCCQSIRGRLSHNGRYFAFNSQSRLVPEDENSSHDVYLRDRGEQPPLPPLPARRTWGPAGSDRGLQKRTTKQVNDPVDTATGALVGEVVDAVLPSVGESFSFARSYTSSDTTSGPLGQGWTHNYLSSLTIDDVAGNVMLRTEGGSQLFFEKQPDSSFLAEPGVVASLVETPGGYEVRTQDLRTYTYAVDGSLAAIEDRNGEGLSFSYSSGLLSSVATSHGDVSLAYTSGLLTSVTLPDGRNVAFNYTSGRLTAVTDLRGNTTNYTYDAAGRLTKITDQNGHDVVTNVYDSATGRVTSQTDANGNTGTFSYADHGNGNAATTYTDARGKKWIDVYLNNVLLYEIDPLGNLTRYRYDERLNLIEVIDPRGNRTSMTYDAGGRITSLVAPQPLSHEHRWTYNALGLVETATNGRGRTTTFTYDALGNIVKIEAPEAVTTTMTYTPEGLLDTLTDARGGITDFDYDARGELASVTDPRGSTATFGYDASGRLTSAVDPRGNEPGAAPSEFTTVLGYDDADNPTTVVDPLGHTTTAAYDPAGNIDSTTDASGHVTDYGYDAGNQLVTIEAPDGAVTTYEYDEVGNLTARTDANNQSETYTYDNAGRLASRSNAVGTWSYAYDANGNLTTMTLPGGDTISLSYDVLNRVVAVDFSDGTPDVAYAYDANSNRVSMTDGLGTVTYTYDDLDRLKTLTRGAEAFSYGYDSASNVTSRTYPDGTTVTATYDDAGNLETVTEAGNTTTYVYDAVGSLIEATLPNGVVETHSYDAAGRLTDTKASNGTATPMREILTLDPVGNPLTATDEGGVTDAYTYDPLNRLTKVCFNATTCAGAVDFIGYSYDPVGNRLTQTTPAGTTTYTYNSADQLTGVAGPEGGVTAYAYDVRGNQIQGGSATFTYDLANRMTSASGATDPLTKTTYRYDGDGSRVAAVTELEGVELVDQQFTWDPNGVLAELVGERARISDPVDTQTVERRYVHGAGPVSMTSEDTTSAVIDRERVAYYHRDHLGSIRTVTNAAGGTDWRYDYEPYGEARTTEKVDLFAPENPLRFTGQYQDPTGLYHLRARQYDPGTGRFTATDPVSAPLGVPHYNAYGYVNQRPTFGVDPTGLHCPTCVGSGIGRSSKAGGGGGGTMLLGRTAGPCTSYGRWNYTDLLKTTRLHDWTYDSFVGPLVVGRWPSPLIGVGYKEKKSYIETWEREYCAPYGGSYGGSALAMSGYVRIVQTVELWITETRTQLNVLFGGPEYSGPTAVRTVTDEKVVILTSTGNWIDA